MKHYLVWNTFLTSKAFVGIESGENEEEILTRLKSCLQPWKPETKVAPILEELEMEEGGSVPWSLIQQRKREGLIPSTF
jgi:hypothetical protein